MSVTFVWISDDKPRLAFIHFGAAAVGTVATIYGTYLTRYSTRRSGPPLEWVILGAWVLAIAGVAMVVAAQVAGVRQGGGRASSQPQGPLWPSEVILPGLGFLSMGAALIHFVVIGEHFAEFWLFGAFFMVVSVFQMAWALLVTARPGRWIVLCGAAVNLLIVGAWVQSRTIGLPWGPMAWQRITAGFGDSVSTALEFLIVVLSLVLLRWEVHSSLAVRATSILGLGLGSLTALALISAVGGAGFIPPSG
jgi:hypothetical protein